MNKRSLSLAFLLFAQFAYAYPAKSVPAPPLKFTQLLNAPAGTKTDWVSLRGKVVVLEFWATWCGPCVASIPHWNELAAQLDPAKFQLVTVDQRETEEKVSAFLQKKPMAGWAGVDRDGAVDDLYGVTSIPVTMIIDRNGRVAAATTPEDLKAADLEAVYDGRPVRFTPAQEAKSALPAKTETRGVGEATVQGPVFELNLTAAKPGTKPFTGVANDTFEKHAVSAVELVADAYQLNQARIDWRAPDDKRLYNFRVKMDGLERRWSFAIYQQDVALALQLKIHNEQETRRVLVLKTNEHARELLKVTEMEGNAGKLCGYYAGRFAIQNVGMEDAAQQLEKLFGVPVLNETGRSELFDVSVKAQEGDLAGLKESLEKEAGLSLIEEERPAEMLVVEKE